MHCSDKQQVGHSASTVGSKHLGSEGFHAAAAVQGCSCQKSISWVMPQLSKSPQAVGKSWRIKVLYRHDASLATHCQNDVFHTTDLQSIHLDGLAYLPCSRAFEQYCMLSYYQYIQLMCNEGPTKLAGVQMQACCALTCRILQTSRAAASSAAVPGCVSWVAKAHRTLERL